MGDATIDRIYVECQCGSPDHLVSFARDTEDYWINVQMSPFLPWWRRAWRAVLYVLGRDGGCHWADTLLSEAERARVAEFLRP